MPDLHTKITVKERLDSKERNVDEFIIYSLSSQKDKEFDRSSQGANAAMSHNQTLSYSITDLNNFINLELSKVGQALPDKSNN